MTCQIDCSIFCIHTSHVIFITIHSCYPISGATYINDGFFLQKVTSSNVGAMSVVLVLVLRLYSGWGYIGSRYVNCQYTSIGLCFCSFIENILCKLN